MKVNIVTQYSLIFALLLISSGIWAQQLMPLDLANRHLDENHKKWSLSEEDISEIRISDAYTNERTGISYVYFIQQFQNIDINNSIFNLSIKDGKVYHVGNRFVSNLSEKVNTTKPVLTPQQAIQKITTKLNILTIQNIRQLSKNGHEYIFEKGEIARADILAKLVFQPNDNKVSLAWNIIFSPIESNDKWNISVDAVSGEILTQTNWTVYCTFDENDYLTIDRATCNNESHSHHNTTVFKENKVLGDGSKYNVWPSPIESPNHGSRVLVEEPADPIASPYGWHDTDGMDGHEYTITRGNNAWAYQARINNQISLNDEPDGGDSLCFDYDWAFNMEPEDYVDASVTNLFYWTNFVHDFSWHMGFDEQAGNFQEHNYGNGGQENDAMIARAQRGANAGSSNNAFYIPTSDGNPGSEPSSINMFIWDSNSELLQVNEPASIAGVYSTSAVDSGWGTGAQVTNVPVTGEVVIALDAVQNPILTDACEDLTNADELVGKIALIDRGGCDYSCKAERAQDAGAIGVIICNFDDSLLANGMGDGACGSSVQIPSIFISSVSCEAIRMNIDNGLEVSLVTPSQSIPTNFDGDLDNGIVAHEYGHGISLRSTGGPSTLCIDGDEQMGEGWSDFFALVTTVKSGDTGDMPRGIATYVKRESTDGRGVRPFPYSTDMSVNPHTYRDISGASIPHGVGSVWCAMLWDMYWAFVEEHGWSEDLLYGAAGNNKAVRLVFESLKMQPCFPGFVDGRDAILAADEMLYNGENQCLIWDVFARRGLGYNAKQGDFDSAGDGVESFDGLPTCVPELKIAKEATELIDAGDEIEIILRVIHHKPDPVTNVVVTDEMPAGLTYVAGSGNITPTITGNILSFELGDLAFDDEKVITYKLQSDPNLYSIQQFLDDVPDDSEDGWVVGFIGDSPPSIWTVLDFFVHSGSWAWTVMGESVETRQLLQIEEPWEVIGNQPVLRFWHNYNTEPGADGGLVDISTDGGMTWEVLDDEIFKNGYPLSLQYSTFWAPHLSAFSGNSGGWIPTYIDLSEYIGEEILFRFRFGTDAGTSSDGWFVDDIEFMDMYNYNGEACATSDQNDSVCAIAPERGTIVESKLESSVTDILEDVEVTIYPNPANDFLTIAMMSENPKDLNVSVTTLEGKEILVREVNLFGHSILPLNISQLPKGLYLVKVFSNERMLVKKVSIQ